MAVALLDSSAVIAYLIADDRLHASAAEVIEQAVREGRTLAVSAVTWRELLHRALLGYFPESSVRGFAQDLGVAVLAVDAAIAERGAALQAAHAGRAKRREGRRLRTPDALILATAAERDEIDLVVGGDRQWLSVPDVGTDIALLAEG